MKKRNRFIEFLWRHSFGIAFSVMAVFVVLLGFIGYNYVVVARRFEAARRFDVPSRIYSDATYILPGLTYKRTILEPKLNHVGYHEVSGPISRPGDYRYVDDDLEIYLQRFDYPDMESIPMPVRIEMDEGTVKRIRRIEDDLALRAIRIEPELITSIYDDVMEDRIPISVASVPKHLTEAIIATEDKDFRDHEGISLRGIIRAARENYQSGQVRQGASTLTQQLVKNLLLTPEKSYKRKIKEIMLSLLLEARYSKDEILEGYINEIYLGQNGAVQIVGVEQAANVYFSKRASNLNLSESATLAGIIKSPNQYTPLKYPDRAKARRDLVLKLMLDQGRITQAEYDKTIKTPLTLNKFPRSINSAPFFVDLVLKQLRETYPETQLKTDGLRIFTTLDTMMQNSAEKSLTSGIASLKKSYSHLRSGGSPLEGVVVTIQPGTGYVKALVGGTSYKKSQFNRAFQAKRQPGSLFKPFVYIAAMDPALGSKALNAATILDDTPIQVKNGTDVWAPQNYDGKFHGRVSVRKALAFSYNIPAVRAGTLAGMNNVVRFASRIGVQSKLQAYPSITLGSFEVTPLEIAFAYSVLANEGVKAQPVTILAVATSDGKLLEKKEVEMKRVAPASVCYVMNDILKDTLDYGTAGQVRSLGFDKPFSGKTGTTNNYRDAWFIGYSPRVLSLVWIGFDDGRSVRLSGGTAAVPIWTQHMKRIMGFVRDADFRRPEDVVQREVDPESGLVASPYCPASAMEVFVRGTEPDTLCPLHNLDFQGPYMRTDDGPPSPWEIATQEPPPPRPGEEPRQRKKKEKGLRKIFPWLFE